MDAAEDLASAAARQAALEDRLAQETDRGLGLERQLSAADTARQEADRRHASELADAAAQLASLQTRYDTAVTEHAAAQAASEQRLTDAATAHQQIGGPHGRRPRCRVDARGRTRRAARARIRRAAGCRTAARLRTGGGCSAARLAPGEVRHGRHGTRCRPGRIGTAVDRRRDGASADGGPHRRRPRCRVGARGGTRRAAHTRIRRAGGTRTGSHRGPHGIRARAGSVPATSSPPIVGAPASRRCSSRRSSPASGRTRTVGCTQKTKKSGRFSRSIDTLQRLLGTTQDELQHLHGTVEAERLAHERARLTSESELLRVSAEYGQQSVSRSIGCSPRFRHSNRSRESTRRSAPGSRPSSPIATAS